MDDLFTPFSCHNSREEKAMTTRMNKGEQPVFSRICLPTFSFNPLNTKVDLAFPFRE